MDYRLDLATVFQLDLARDERVMWASQPQPGLHLSGADLFLVPFSLIWGGFAIVWEAGVWGAFSSHGAAPGFFVLWGFPFVAVGQYLIWGRFVYKAYRNRRTFYAVTNQRILIVNTMRSRQLQSLFLTQLPNINKVARRDGSGSLVFGTMPYATSMYANSGLEFFGSWRGPAVLAFYDIADVDEVYQLIMRLKSDLQRSA